MTKVYLIRHGRTAWNKDVRFRGLTTVGNFIIIYFSHDGAGTRGSKASFSL